MIHQQKDKKNKSIYIYIFLFIFFASINNKNLYDKILFSNKLIFKISGLSDTENRKLMQDLINENKDNIFKLDKNKLSNIINENNLVLNFLAKKNYPNKIEIKINKVKYIGRIYRNDKLSLIGSNGKLINNEIDKTTELPYFYGNFTRKEFLEFFSIINKVGLETENISSFYFFPSGRWDVRFKNNLLLKLPNKNLKNILSKALLLKNDLNFKNSKIIDLRIKNKIITNG